MGEGIAFARNVITPAWIKYVGHIGLKLMSQVENTGRELNKIVIVSRTDHVLV